MQVVKKKICLLGDFSAGKTSLIRRFVEGEFDEKYLSTIGVNISRKLIDHDGDQINFIIWDLAGGEEFSKVNKTYLRGAAGAIVVCDLSRLETLQNMQSYAQLAREVNPQIALVLAANKSDLVAEREVSEQDLDSTAAILSAPLLLTSAKSGDQVEALFQRLAEAIELVER